MYKKEENMLAQWSDRMIDYEDGRLVFRPSVDYPLKIVHVDRVMRALLRSKAQLFRRHRVCGKMKTIVHPVAKAVRKCANIDFEDIQAFFCKHKLSPYFLLLADEFRTYKADVIIGRDPDVDLANAWAERVRALARASEFSALVASQERSARKNAKAAVEYLEALYRSHSRLCVVRLDASYDVAYRDQRPGRTVEVVRIKRDLGTLLRKLRHRYPSLVGYAWKLEYAPRKSYHVHLMFFFNGHQVRQDESIARAIGEYWQEVVTNGDGGYWNCNANKAFYERANALGIGMVEHDDLEKRKRLKYTLLYLTKADYYVRLSEPDIGRTFGKAQLERVPSVKLGRPRR